MKGQRDKRRTKNARCHRERGRVSERMREQTLDTKACFIFQCRHAESESHTVTLFAVTF